MALLSANTACFRSSKREEALPNVSANKRGIDTLAIVQPAETRAAAQPSACADRANESPYPTRLRGGDWPHDHSNADLVFFHGCPGAIGIEAIHCLERLECFGPEVLFPYHPVLADHETLDPGVPVLGR